MGHGRGAGNPAEAGGQNIVDALSISERTVENRVAGVLKKLGLRSRGYVAARLGERP